MHAFSASQKLIWHGPEHRVSFSVKKLHANNHKCLLAIDTVDKAIHGSNEVWLHNYNLLNFIRL